jgi:hypothetical protein
MRGTRLNQNGAALARVVGDCIISVADLRRLVTMPGGCRLNSLRIGFRTLAIQKRSSEVWQVLAAVKTEFGKYGEVLDKGQRKASRSVQYHRKSSSAAAWMITG